MERKIVYTKDGSHTVAIPQLSVTYHSLHGAIQESQQVYIEAGLHHILPQTPLQPVAVFEMGFGTGLNALLTAVAAQRAKVNIRYTAVELYPLTMDEIAALNYDKLLKEDTPLFQQLHLSRWHEPIAITEYFTLQKLKADLTELTMHETYDLVYYDAFAPAAQPELWTTAIFEKLYGMLQPNGVLVTYCSKGDVRRAMQAAGFTVTKLPGPPGKREIVRAIRFLHTSVKEGLT